MQKFIVSLAVLIASLATASVASAQCPPGQSQLGAYCVANPPGQPADRPPVDPGPGNPPGQPADRPAAANTPSDASLSTTLFLSQVGLDGLAEEGSYTRTFVAPGPGVYRERVYGRVFAPYPSGATARAAAHMRPRYVLIAYGQRNFKGAGAGQVKMRLSKRGARLIGRRDSLMVLAKTQFVRTRNGQATTRTTGARTQSVSKKGPATAS